MYIYTYIQREGYHHVAVGFLHDTFGHICDGSHHPHSPYSTLARVLPAGGLSLQSTHCLTLILQIALSEHGQRPFLICKVLSKIKCNKAAGPSGIVAEMLKAAGEEGVELVRQLTEAIFSCCMIPSHWQESFILNLRYLRQRQSPSPWQLSWPQAHRSSHEAAGMGTRLLHP